ncbi:hypothetical protein K469DRAFT_547411, partial [Zopfia rhizophila CBS 207.26]
TADPQYANVINAIGDFVATRTEAPASVITATDTVATYTASPTWYTALPENIKSYMQSVVDVRNSIASSVIHNGAPAARPTGAVRYMGAGLAAAAAGAALLL